MVICHYADNMFVLRPCRLLLIRRYAYASISSRHAARLLFFAAALYRITDRAGSRF